MKKITLLLIVLTISFIVKAQLHVPLVNAPVIDGVVDGNDSWGNNWIDLSIAGFNNTTSDMSSKFQMSHDADNIYVVIVTNDASPNNDQMASPETYQRDNGEVYFSMHSPSGDNPEAYYTDNGDWQIRFQRASATDQYIDGSTNANNAADQFTYAVQDNGSQYVQEMAFPIALLKENGDFDGVNFRFDVQAADNENGSTRTQQQFWYSGSDNQWNDVSVLGQGVLENSNTTYTVTFTVTDGTNTVEGASVKLAGYTVATDANGQATINGVFPGTSIAFTITKADYYKKSGTVAVSNSNITVDETLTLIPSYTVTFNVTDGINPIAGADVNLTGYGTATTDANGQALISGVYEGYSIAYSIHKALYDIVTGTVTVTNSDISENVTMAPYKSIIVPMVNAPVIDGVIDGNDPWGSTWINIDNARPTNSTSAMSSKFQIAHDADNIYIALMTNDATPHNEITINNPYEKDNTQVYFSMHSPTGEYPEVYQADQGDWQIRFQRYSETGTYIDGSSNVLSVANQFQYAVVDDGNSYIQEMAFPISVLKENGDFDGSSFRFDIEADDNTTGTSSGRTQLQYWNSNSDDQWHDVTVLGSAMLETTCTLTLVVTDGSSPVAGATVTLSDSNSGVTDGNGKVTFDYTNQIPQLDYTVSLTNYNDATGTILSSNGNFTLNRILIGTHATTHSVNFTVNDVNSNPITGARVELDGYGQGTTDSNGQLSFSTVLPADNIAYTVSGSGFETVENTVSVVAADVPVTVNTTDVHTLTDADVTVTNGQIVSCSYNFDLTKIIIPSTLDGQTVTSTGYEAFYGKGITSVVLPSTITELGQASFAHNSIESLALPNSVVILRQACFSNNNLTNLALSTGLKKIERGAFDKNSNLASIDLSGCTSLIYIGELAFADGTLASFVLPTPTNPNFNGWKDGSGNEFAGGATVSNLGVRYYVPYTLTDNDVVAFNGTIVSCSYNFEYTDIKIPDVLDGQTVTQISDGNYPGVFQEKGITSVQLPSSVEKINNSAFYHNTNLNVDFSNCTNLTEIGENAFSSNNITNIDLSYCTSLKIIGDYSFENNNNNAGVLLPASIQYIGRYTFAFNYNVNSVDLSACTNLYNIGSYAFAYNNITQFNLPTPAYPGFKYWIDGNNNQHAGDETVTNFYISYKAKINYTLTDDDVVVKNGFITSCNYDFTFKDIIIPEKLDGQTVIGVARGSSSGIFQNKGLTSVDLPNTLLSIAPYTFASNGSLAGIIFPNPTVSGTTLNYWQDDNGSTYTAGSVISNVNYGYNAIFANPVVVLSETDVNYGSIPAGGSKTLALKVYNSSPNNLTVSSLTLPSDFLADWTSGTIDAFSTQTINITLTPSKLGSYNDKVTLNFGETVAGNTSVTFTAQGSVPPVMSVDADTLTALITSCGGTKSKYFTINNNGNGNLEYEIHPHVEVLALTAGVNTNQYNNAIYAISETFIDYHITEINTQDALELQDALKDKDVFLVAGQRQSINGISNNVFTGFAPVLQNFVNNGGEVIFCGTGASTKIFNTGLFSGNINNYDYGGTPLNCFDINSPLLAGIDATFISSDRTFNYQINNSDAISLVGNNWGDVVTYRKVGKGKAILIGYNYNSSDNIGFNKIMANAVSFNAPRFIALSKTAGTISGTGSQNIEVQFYTVGLVSGSHLEKLKIVSNDPDNNTDNLICKLIIEGEPALSLSTHSINFDNEKVNGSETKSFYINNTGCDTLEVSNLTFTNTVFSLGSSISKVAPFDSVKIDIEFTSLSATSYTENLIVETNAGNQQLSLSGTGTGAPVINFSPGSFTAKVDECGGSVTKQITISNNGCTDLDFNLSYFSTQFSDDFEHGLSKWSYTGSWGLSTNSHSGSYSISESPGTNYDNNWDYSIETKDEINVISAEKYILSYWLYRDMESCCDYLNTQVNINNNGWTTIESVNGYYFWDERVLDLSSMVKKGDKIRVRFQFTSDGSVSSNGVEIDDVYVGPKNLSSRIITFSPNSGTIAPDGQITVDANFDASNLLTDNYPIDIIVNSNDPLALLDTIHSLFIVNGSPEIIINKSQLAFNEVMINGTKTKSIYIKNEGCDTLEVVNATSSNSVFEPVFSTTMKIAPDDSSKFEISFNPIAEGIVNSTLTIESNVGNKQITLTGAGIGSPVADLSTHSIAATASSCGVTTSQSFTITNSGNNDLQYNLEVVDTVELLAYTAGINTTQYANALSSINRYFNKYNLTETNTEDAGELEKALSGKDVLLISGQADYVGVASSVFTGFTNVLQNFANSGGTVVFCGSEASDKIFNTGLFNGSFNSWQYSGYTLTVNDLSDPLMDGMPSTFQAVYKTFFYTINNSDAISLVEAQWGSNVIYRNIGLGKAIIIGYNFYISNTGFDRILANAVSTSVKNYISLDVQSGTVASANGTQDINVTYDSYGLKSGDHTAYIVVNSNDPVTPTDTITSTLTVSGNPEISASANSIDFGEEFVGSSRDAQFTLSNAGCDSLIITSVNIINTVFSIDINTPDTIAPFSNKTFLGYFIPTVEGTETGSIAFVNNTGTNEVISVTGTGNNANTAIIALSGDLAFGDQPLATTTTKTLTISNSGNSDLSISGIAMPYSDIYVNATYPITVGAGSSETVNVTFEPYNVQSYDGNITVSSNATGGTSSIAYTATGIAITQTLELSMTSTDFGNVAVGNSSTKTLTLTNTGNTAFYIGDLYTPYGFYVNGNTYYWIERNLSPGASINLNIDFTPISQSFYNGYIEVYGNFSGSYTTLTVSGTGVAPTRVIDVAISNTDFGIVEAGYTSTQTLTINNTGNAPLNITGYTISDPDFSADFTGLIPAGGSHDVNITFAPNEVKTYSGVTIEVLSDATAITNKSVTVGGIGDGSEITLSGTLDFGTVTIGSPATATLTIANPTNYDFAISSLVMPNAAFTHDLDFSSGDITITKVSPVTATITFTPTAADFYSGDISVTGNFNAGTNTISVSGTGAGSKIELAGDLAFGNIPDGETAIKTFTISNTGTADLTVSGITLPDAVFSSDVVTPFVISSGTGKEVTLTFVPGAISDYSGTIGITSDATEGTGSIDVSAAGTDGLSADFSADQTTGEVPLTVNFTNNSTGADSYLWNFGDGGASKLENPQHVYADAGYYNVSLTAKYGDYSKTITKNNYITVTSPTERAVTFTITDGTNPVSGAVVTAGGMSLTPTDASGHTTTNLNDGNYTYSVSAQGYENISPKAFTVSGTTSITQALVASKFNLEFIVTDNGAYINDATVTVFDGTTQVASVLTTDGSGTVALPAGTYNYTVDATGYNSYTSSADVVITDADASEEVLMIPTSVPTFNATFRVSDGSSAISGATVSISGSNYTTDASGAVTVSGFKNGTYGFTVLASGFENSIGTITIAGSAINKTVTMQAIVASVYTATFNVKNETGDPVAGASVNVEGLNYTTDANGTVAVTNLVNWTYSYTISEEHYNDETGSITISGANITKDVSVSVMLLDGTVAIIDDGTPQYGETLTVDKSGITNNTGSLSYQWVRNGSDIVGATQSEYKLVLDDIGETITIEVSSSVQSGSLTSSETGIVQKGNQAKPAVPTLAGKTDNSITLNTLAGAEYSINGGAWTSTVEFTGLNQATQYSLTQRMAETATNKASAASNALLVKTDGSPLAGTVTITDDGTPQYGETLTVDVSGITNNTGTLSYQWKRGGVNIANATSSTYTLTVYDIEATITLVVSSSEQTGTVTSTPTGTVIKADQSAPDTPTLSGKTNNSIVLNTVTGCEYSIDNGSSWQQSPEFTALSASTDYTLYQRYAESNIYFASGSSSSLAVTTDAALGTDLTGTVAITGTTVYGQILTADASGITNNTGTLSYQWKRNGSAISGATGTSYTTYTLVESDIATNISVEVNSDQQTGSVSSAQTAPISKADQTAPLAPVLVSKTNTAVYLTTTSGNEYSIDGTIWQTTGDFTGLTANTSYSFYQRIKATTTQNASPASGALAVTTNPNALQGTVAVTQDGTPQFGEVLTANISGITNNTGTLNYQWKRGGIAITGATSSTYTLTVDDIGTSISVVVSSTIETGTKTSSLIPAVTKADQAAPVVPALVSKTINSITIASVSGCEYSINGGTWVSGTTFTALTPGTVYSFTQRYKSSSTQNASAASGSAVISTDPVYNVVFNVTDGTHAIQGATVSLSGYGDVITNSSGHATFNSVIPGNISYTISKATYNNSTGTVTVTSTDVSQDVTLNLITYAVTFTVTDGTTAIQGATVTLAGYGAVTTDASGMAVVSGVVPANSIAYSVSKAAYNTASGTISVTSSNVSENVTLNLTTYAVTYTVTDGTTAIQGATVTLAGYTAKTTNANGQAVISGVLPGDSIAYTVSMAGYEDAIGTVTVTNADVSQSVNIGKTYSVTFTVTDGANAIEGAVVKLTGYGNDTTDAAGQVVFSGVIPADTIAYTISKATYDDAIGTVSVTNSDVTENVAMNLTTYTVTFNVTDGTNPVKGAKVNFGGTDYDVDTTGVLAITKVLPKAYVYAVTATGYDSITNKSATITSDKTINIIMVESVYSVTFNVNSIAKSIPGVIITFNGTTNKMDVTTITGVKNGTYAYTVAAAGFTSVSGSVTVKGANVTENVNLSAIIMTYTVNFNITDGTNALAGAKVTFVDSTYTSDVNGSVKIADVKDGVYTYSVVFDGYNSATGSVTVAGRDVTEKVTLTAVVLTHSVTFNVTDGANPIPNATITFDSTDYTVTNEGSVIITGIEDGIYGYDVKADGYLETTGEVIVSGSDVSEDVVLKTVEIQSENQVLINIYPNPADKELYITYNSVISAMVIYNLTGKIIYTRDDINDKGTAMIDVSDYPQGIYLLKAVSGNKITVVRIAIK